MPRHFRITYGEDYGYEILSKHTSLNAAKKRMLKYATDDKESGEYWYRYTWYRVEEYHPSSRTWWLAYSEDEFAAEFFPKEQFDHDDF